MSYHANRVYIGVDGSFNQNGATMNLSGPIALGGATGVNYMTLVDNLAAAYTFKEGSTSYLNFKTTNSAEAVEVGKTLALAAGVGVTLSGSITFGGATGENIIAMPDNLAVALAIKEGSTVYVSFTTTNSGEAINVAKNVVLSDGVNITANATTGTKIGTAISEKLGFHNATPVAQRAGAAQAAVATDPAIDEAHFGYTEAQANAIVALVNELRAALVEKGIIKGAA